MLQIHIMANRKRLPPNTSINHHLIYIKRSENFCLKVKFTIIYSDSKRIRPREIQIYKLFTNIKCLTLKTNPQFNFKKLDLTYVESYIRIDDVLNSFYTHKAMKLHLEKHLKSQDWTNMIFQPKMLLQSVQQNFDVFSRDFWIKTVRSEGWHVY